MTEFTEIPNFSEEDTNRAKEALANLEKERTDVQTEVDALDAQIQAELNKQNEWESAADVDIDAIVESGDHVLSLREQKGVLDKQLHAIAEKIAKNQQTIDLQGQLHTLHGLDAKIEKARAQLEAGALSGSLFERIQAERDKLQTAIKELFLGLNLQKTEELPEQNTTEPSEQHADTHDKPSTAELSVAESEPTVESPTQEMLPETKAPEPESPSGKNQLKRGRLLRSPNHAALLELWLANPDQPLTSDDIPNKDTNPSAAMSYFIKTFLPTFGLTAEVATNGKRKSYRIKAIDADQTERIRQELTTELELPPTALEQIIITNVNALEGDPPQLEVASGPDLSAGMENSETLQTLESLGITENMVEILAAYIHLNSERVKALYTNNNFKKTQMDEVVDNLRAASALSQREIHSENLQKDREDAMRAICGLEVNLVGAVLSEKPEWGKLFFFVHELNDLAQREIAQRPHLQHSNEVALLAYIQDEKALKEKLAEEERAFRNRGVLMSDEEKAKLIDEWRRGSVAPAPEKTEKSGDGPLGFIRNMFNRAPKKDKDDGGFEIDSSEAFEDSLGAKTAPTPPQDLPSKTQTEPKQQRKKVPVQSEPVVPPKDVQPEETPPEKLKGVPLAEAIYDAYLIALKSAVLKSAEEGKMLSESSTSLLAPQIRDITTAMEVDEAEQKLKLSLKKTLGPTMLSKYVEMLGHTAPGNSGKNPHPIFSIEQVATLLTFRYFLDKGQNGLIEDWAEDKLKTYPAETRKNN